MPSWNSFLLSLPFLLPGVLILVGSAAIAKYNHQVRLTQMEIAKKEVEQEKGRAKIKLLILRTLIAGSPLDRIMIPLVGLAATSIGIYVLFY